ncbi:MAG: F0F1 ATP synthase subunit gamma [Rhodospirillales bacterium CG15_BIG_FIL_POST_REV_8_21_14_020_66_15]|nr:MAG: F0F1 ATP synthase subunit gamma [Rhodospirillales bacterium CG15_BIG_FIL_POST_REV_8_21_14_020_66_15]
MPSLKDLKIRINSVKSTQKITSAMKMVAAAKLRRAQEGAEAARPYAKRMEGMVAAIGASIGDPEGAPKMLAGTGKSDVHLLVACTADRGLCGGFNGSIVREVRNTARRLKTDGKTVKILCVGKKARDLLKRDLAKDIVHTVEGIGRRGVEYHEAEGVAHKITEMFEAGEFDVCTIVFNRFQSAMTQVVTKQQVIPFQAPKTENQAEKPAGPSPVYLYEPEEEEILAALLPRNLAVQLFQALLESSASEHGARMTAMDSATRNAGDMIDNLTLTYNRTRQAFITKELIEIISGAEAL